MPEAFIDPSIDTNAISIRSDEVLIGAYKVDIQHPSHVLTTTEALQLLAGVEKAEDIGKKGPLVASHALPENQHHQDLRLYETVFGRDALVAAQFLLDSFPRLAQNTLLYLAILQGTKQNAASEEEPGKITHEARLPDDPVAQSLTKKYGWGWPYYGSVDSTPRYIRLLLAYVLEHDFSFLQQTYRDRDGKVQTMLHSLQLAMQWVKSKMDSNPDGLIESMRINIDGGLISQAWKDSQDAYHHADGSLVNHTQGVSSIEVQALAYDSLSYLADVYQQLATQASAPEEKSSYESEGADATKRAKKLADYIWDKFWLSDERGSYFALGGDRHEDGQVDALAVRTSNMGHLLNSRLLDDDNAEAKKRKEALVASLWQPDMLNVNGIRTLSSLENRFRPNSYHNGSVWLWDTYEIALGLRRQGYEDKAADLCKRIRMTISATQRFPEYVAGTDTPTTVIPHYVIKVFDTTHQMENVIERPPQDIQAWTVAAAAAIEHTRK